MSVKTCYVCGFWLQDDRHTNAAVSSLLLYFYSSAATLLMLECMAYFKAITAGIIGGLAKARIGSHLNWRKMLCLVLVVFTSLASEGPLLARWPFPDARHVHQKASMSQLKKTSLFDTQVSHT